LLLVDGLDEISDPAARAGFARQLDQIHRAYPEAPMVITSRIVGYREMGYRIRGEVEHLTVANLSAEDKDDFARRWCALVERGERREAAAADLIRDIHSSDRIERLTGNPMLLTTMALIKRKIGKLPQRRVELYEKTVEVLLNWRSEVDAAMDKREVLPQLEYLAHAMCDRGTQQLREDEALELLSRVREEYPQIHPMRQHSPEEFLTLLERRTGLLIQSGHTRHNGQSVPVYEFRHLTIQEYLAGIAVVQGHFSNRDREKSLAQQVAELAGRVGPAGSDGPRKIPAVADHWREALRLCVAGCNDDAVDDVLRAIFTPLPGEADTASARTELAALCLADEPNVSETLAQEILGAFASSGGDDLFEEDFRVVAGVELSTSRWKDGLLACLLREFFQCDGVGRTVHGSLIGTVVEKTADVGQFPTWLRGQAEVLRAGDEKAAALAALAIMEFAFSSRNCAIADVIAGLMGRLEGSAPMAHAAAWALAWINGNGKNVWHPSPGELEYLIAIAARSQCEPETMFWFALIFGNERSSQAVEILLPCLCSDSKRLRKSTVDALGKIGDVRAVDALLALLADKQAGNDIWRATADALGKIGDVRAVDALLALLADMQAGDVIRKSTVKALGKIGDGRAVDALLESDDIRKSTVKALGKLGGEKALAVVRELLNDSNSEMRRAALGALSQNRQDEIERRLVSRDLDAFPPFIDPQAPIAEAEVMRAAEILNHSCDEIRFRYQSLADQFGLKLEWQ
jgi:HEAT repeat protein